MKKRFFLSMILVAVLLVGSRTISYAEVIPTPNATFAVAYNVCPIQDESSTSSLPFVLPLLLAGIGAGVYIGKKQASVPSS